MRIISGKYKGRTLRFHLAPNIRPSTDSTREALFNTLSNFIDFEGIRVLDLFSGTGLLGLESLSRGASFCHFVDKNITAIKIIDFTTKMLSINSKNFRITQADVFSFLNTFEPEIGFDLIFSDPPYNLKLTDKLFSHPRLLNILSENSLIVCETSIKETIQVPAKFHLLSKKIYGDTSILFLTYLKNGE